MLINNHLVQTELTEMILKFTNEKNFKPTRADLNVSIKYTDACVIQVILSLQYFNLKLHQKFKLT